MDDNNIRNNIMDIHSVSLRGRRNQNEDKHNVILNIDGKDQEKAQVNYFGVYDGHGGKFVSKFLAKNLPNFFIDKRVQYPLKKKYIYAVYEHLQKILREKYASYSTQCGSTCLVAIHSRKLDVNYVNIMNTGDSRCVLCRDNLAITLTKDHKPNWPEERNRIEKLGGQIYSDGTDFRIKDLSVSRAFGDVDAEPYLTCMPDIYRYKLDKNDKFMILACDGLWDVMTGQDAINFVLNECYDNTLNTRINTNINVARKLAEFAIHKGSLDNVSILIIFF
jgi:serine/threonine protein phosphatase PrpC